MTNGNSSTDENLPPPPPVPETAPVEPALPSLTEPAFLLVGVGASASGLSAFREFLEPVYDLLRYR